MDIGNLNKVYSIVSSAGNQQILNVSGDQKVLSLADGSSQLSPKQIEDNRTFHLGLLNSLTAITNDQAVLAEVRTKLGLPEKGENLEPKSIFARDIKAAIDLVMANVSKRIGEVLTRPFPDAVNKLILEAVKANPKHDVVKAFLANEGGTLDNLARLCRLTCQSLTDGANSAALAYLDGFAYDVADFVNVLKVSVSDNQQYEAGVNHRTEEEKAKTEKKTKPTEIKNTQLLRMNSTMEKDEVNEEFLTDIFSKKTEMHGKVDKNSKNDVDKGGEAVKLDFNAFCDNLERDYQTKNSSKRNVFEPFITELRADADGCFAKRIKSFLEETSLYTSDEFKTDKKRLEKLNEEIRTLVSAEQSFRKDRVKQIFEKSVCEAKIAIKRPKVFDEAVKLCESEIEKLEKAMNSNYGKMGLSQLVDLSMSIHDLLTVQVQDAELYETASKVYTSGMRMGNDDKQIAKDVANVIKTAINNALDDTDLREPQNVVPTNPKSQKYTKNTLLTQGNTNTCYLRSFENALLAKGKPLPTLDKGTYTFNVTFVYGESGTGKKKMFTREIKVNKDEIAALKTWYAQKDIEGYKNQKNDLTDLDWAVNIAQAKKDAVRNIMNKKGGNEAENVKNAEAYELKELTQDTIRTQDEEGTYNVTKQHITASGYDEDVAALFGLMPDPVCHISINHAGYAKSKGRSVQEYMGTEDKDLEPKALYDNFNEVRNWKKANPDGILTLNEAGKHFVAVTGFYFVDEKNFGFIVRDSNKTDNMESKINVVGYAYDKVTVQGNCKKLTVNGYLAPTKSAA